MGFCVEFVKNIDLFTVSTNLSTRIVDNSGACTHTPAEHNGCTQTEKKCLHIHISIISSNREYFNNKTPGNVYLWRLSLSAKELISSDALIFLRRNGGEAMKYECLKLEERRIIEEMYAKGAKPGEIAERVGKCQATIYRELERGKTGETDSRFRQGYSAAVAEARVNRSY